MTGELLPIKFNHLHKFMHEYYYNDRRSTSSTLGEFPTKSSRHSVRDSLQTTSILSLGNPIFLSFRVVLSNKICCPIPKFYAFDFVIIGIFLFVIDYSFCLNVVWWRIFTKYFCLLLGMHGNNKIYESIQII